jgi:large subunit ribosomal protein L10
MNKETLNKKIETVEGYKSKLNSSNFVLFFNFNALPADVATSLRRDLKAIDSEMVVGRTTLFFRAFENTIMHDHRDVFVGPTAIVFSYKDPAKTAKIVFDTCKSLDKENPLKFIKAGMLSNKYLTPKDVEALANLPSMEVLVSKLMGVLQAPVVGFIMALKAVPQKLVLTLKALEEAKNS